MSRISVPVCSGVKNAKMYVAVYDYQRLACRCKEVIALEDLALQEDLQHTQEDFEMHVIPLVKQHPRILKADVFTLDNFRRAASWVASRAFGVDSHHGAILLAIKTAWHTVLAMIGFSCTKDYFQHMILTLARNAVSADCLLDLALTRLQPAPLMYCPASLLLKAFHHQVMMR